MTKAFIRAGAIVAAVVAQSFSGPASAQRFEDESPIGTSTNAEVRALAAGFCRDNGYQNLGYTSLQDCEDGIFDQMHPESTSTAVYDTIELPSGGQACHYYGSPGRISAGPCR